MARALIRVYGLVQGVFFRDFARREGERLGLSVVATNLDDGSVAIEASGPREAIEQLAALCRTGPPLARVERVEIEWG